MAIKPFQYTIERPDFLAPVAPIEEKVVNPNPPKTIEVADSDATLTVNGKKITRDSDPSNYELIMGIRKNPLISPHWSDIKDANKMPPDFEIKDGLLTMRDENGKVLAQIKDFGKAPVKESVEPLNETANQDVIKMFLEDSFPKNKRDVWGTTNVKIRKENQNDWSLVNYSTPILFRHAESVWYNGTRYSVTTSKIQSQIRGLAGQLGIDLVETDGNGIKDAIEKAHGVQESVEPVKPKEEPKPKAGRAFDGDHSKLQKNSVGRILL